MTQRRSLSDLANEAIDALSPVQGGWTNQDIAELMNATAEKMFADGEIDKPVIASKTWVWQLRKGERGGQPIEVGSRTLMVFARAVGVPFGYFAGGEEYAEIEAELARLIALKANTGAMSVAHRVANLPDREREAVMQALAQAEEQARK